MLDDLGLFRSLVCLPQPHSLRMSQAEELRKRQMEHERKKQDFLERQSQTQENQRQRVEWVQCDACDKWRKVEQITQEMKGKAW